MSPTKKSWSAAALGAGIAVLALPLSALPLSAAPGEDIEGPSVSITAPAAGAVVGGTVGITGAVVDASASTRYLASPSGISYVENVSDPISEFSIDTTRWADGPVTLSFHAVDEHGNKGAGASAVISLVVDNTAPVASLSAPGSDGEFTVGDSINVTGSVVDAHPWIYHLSVDGRGVDYRSGTASAEYSYTLDTSSLAPGAHTVTLSTRDRAGNAGPASAVSVRIHLVAAAPPVVEEPGEPVEEEPLPGEGDPSDEQPGEEDGEGQQPGGQPEVQQPEVQQPQQPGGQQPQQPAAPQQTGAPQPQLLPFGTPDTLGGAPTGAGLAAPTLTTLPAPEPVPASVPSPPPVPRAAEVADDDEQLETFALSVDSDEASAAGGGVGSVWQLALLGAGLVAGLAVLGLLILFLIARRRRRYS